MDVTVMLFGPQADLAGCREIQLQVDATATCAELRRALASHCPTLIPSLGDSRFAVNQQMVDDNHVVQACDEVALIGLVSGG